MENEKSQQTKESAKPQKPNSNKKERPAIIKKRIEEERKNVIELDLELSFIADQKAKHPNADPPIDIMYDESGKKAMYEYHLARLTFFKGLRDKLAPMRDEDVKAVKEDIEKNTPADLKVQKEMKE
jgi:hypothetical protein